MTSEIGTTWGQTITEIHYHNNPYHVPNSVCQSKDINDAQRQHYRLTRVSLDGELLDCVEAKWRFMI